MESRLSDSEKTRVCIDVIEVMRSWGLATIKRAGRCTCVCSVVIVISMILGIR